MFSNTRQWVASNVCGKTDERVAAWLEVLRVLFFSLQVKNRQLNQKLQ